MTISRPSPSGSAQIDGVSGEVIEPSGVDRVPRLKVFWDRWRFPLDGLGLRQAVLDGEPRVMLDDNCATDEFARDRPVPIAARRGGAGRRRDRRGAARLADQPAASDARAGAGCGRRLGIAGRFHARHAHPPARARTAAATTSPDISARPSSKGRSAARSTPTISALAFTARYEAARSPISSRDGSRTARWTARSCSAPPATRTRASSTARNSAPGRGRPAASDEPRALPEPGDQMGPRVVPPLRGRSGAGFPAAVGLRDPRPRAAIRSRSEAAAHRIWNAASASTPISPNMSVHIAAPRLGGAARRSGGWLHVMCLCLLVGRVLHAWGVSRAAKTCASGRPALD